VGTGGSPVPTIFLYERTTIFTMKDMKELKKKLHVLHELHGDLSFFVVPARGYSEPKRERLNN